MVDGRIVAPKVFLLSFFFYPHLRIILLLQNLFTKHKEVVSDKVGCSSPVINYGNKLF